MNIASLVFLLSLIPAGPVTIPEWPDMYDAVQGMWTEATWRISQMLSSVDENVFQLSASLTTSSICAMDSLSTFAITIIADTYSLLVDMLDNVELCFIQFGDHAVSVTACVLGYCGNILDNISSLFGQCFGFLEQVLSVHKHSLFIDFTSSFSTKDYVRLGAGFSFVALCVSVIWMGLEMREHLGRMHRAVASLGEENRHLRIKLNAEFNTLEERQKENERALTETRHKSQALSMWLNVYTAELSRKLDKQSAGQFVRRSLQRQKLL
ncbi:uncharacterized protein LOC134279483 isoform X1 [Saccostrea cucullata]|uniref:uncharacterized protein LOC134279483 isoform X1 n=2 Tax=Saccostrea cuccullata TaxID=36930 RepID=UPI002ED3AC15